MSYVTPQPPIERFREPVRRGDQPSDGTEGNWTALQNHLRRLYERINNLESVTNSQSVANGRLAQAPPQAGLQVTSKASAPGHAYVRITLPQFLIRKGNPIAAPILHWTRASPNAQFNGKVTDFGISGHNYFATSELGSGTFYFEVRSSFDGKTFNNPIYQKVVIP